jgi:hemoglobin/transferrin/lactoferrin receptor protein
MSGILVSCLPLEAWPDIDSPAELNRECLFHIPAGSLESALLEFGRETHMQVIIVAAVADLKAPAVEGRLTRGAALRILLGRTGLTYAVIANTLSVGGASAGIRDRVIPPQ